MKRHRDTHALRHFLNGCGAGRSAKVGYPAKLSQFLAIDADVAQQGVVEQQEAAVRCAAAAPPA